MAVSRAEAAPLFEIGSAPSDAATKRIAEMREHYAKSGLDADGLSDLDLALRELDMQVKEGRQVQNRYDRMIHEQSDHDRKVYAAAKRAEQDNRLAWSEMYMGALVSRALYDLKVLIHKAETLPDRPKPGDLNSLKTAARDAREMLKGHPRDESMKVAEHWRAEAWRLRDYIATSGRALHAESEAKSGGCFCRGCELIRGMDDIENPNEQTGA
jgi:hypothetical protein